MASTTRRTKTETTETSAATSTSSTPEEKPEQNVEEEKKPGLQPQPEETQPIVSLTEAQLKRQMEIFESLFTLDVGEHVEKKNTGKATLSYLSWPWAWAEVKRRYPAVNYEIVKNSDNMPYFASPLGIMVYTRVTLEGITHEMWLPVMDGANNAMKMEPYEITTKFGSKQVNAATMMDINKTVMRCLVKNLAMFGIGLYIYAGEDLPSETLEVRKAKEDEKADREKRKHDVIAAIDTFMLPMVQGLSTEEKKEIFKQKVVPVIGTMNYRACDDLEKLEELLNTLLAEVDQK